MKITNVILFLIFIVLCMIGYQLREIKKELHLNLVTESKVFVMGHNMSEWNRRLETLYTADLKQKDDIKLYIEEIKNEKKKSKPKRKRKGRK